uniref:G protein-coupled receptor n=1 Tax=Angiostrongylus cantonensis TaxID=6313 RepID=A0A158PAY9_ANGCA
MGHNQGKEKGKGNEPGCFCYYDVVYFVRVLTIGRFPRPALTVRLLELRGVLLALTSLYQSLCLIFEFVNVFVGFHGIPIRRHTCFVMMAPYLVFCHMIARLWVYVLTASLPPILYAVCITTLNVIETVGSEDNPRITLCTLSLSIDPSLKRLWVYWNGLSNLTVFFILFGTLATVVVKEKRRVRLNTTVKESNEKRMIFALMAYSMNYYVCFARDSTYRQAFLEQLSCVLPERLNSFPYGDSTPFMVFGKIHECSSLNTHHRQHSRPCVFIPIHT